MFIDFWSVLVHSDSTFISIKLNHGGYFVGLSKRLYMEGEVDYFDFIDPGMLTVDELKDIARRIKYAEPIRLYYVVPGSNLEDGYEYGNSTDYASVSEHRSICSSSDEDITGGKKEKFIEFNVDTDMEDSQFIVEMLFADNNEFKRAIWAHGIKERRNFQFKKDDLVRVRAKYCPEDCKCVCHARKVKNEETFQIRTYFGEHTYSKVWSNKLCNSNVVSDCQGLRAKKKALMKVTRQVAEQYAFLERYIVELLRSNPNSTVLLKTDDHEIYRFQIMYVCFETCKKGYTKGCRKLICVDGCHLKAPGRGQLLTAIGIDPSNSFYLVNYAAVEVKNKDSWSWFLKLVIDDIHIEDSK
ncbi:hypothetical protein ACH5RR_015750 [Cinchona calisaya]|uniref:Transposase MuDR plant domain-containing protein n=1 Tax=Cinchona calisaya TaxID=153742 RepID=A0ABD2ZTZ3_9GENT